MGTSAMLARQGFLTSPTTASVIWSPAPIGAIIALDQFAAATAFAIVTVVVLNGLEFLERSIGRLTNAIVDAVSSLERH